MAKAKTRKLISERVKVTAKGKLLRRIAPFDHFRAKKSGQFSRSRRRSLKSLDHRLIKSQAYY